MQGTSEVSISILVCTTPGIPRALVQSTCENDTRRLIRVLEWCPEKLLFSKTPTLLMWHSVRPLSSTVC